MIKTNQLFIVIVLLISAISFAQVGIGTKTPAPSSILELSSSDKALLLPRVASAATIITPVNGMIIYDEDLKCIRAYENDAWTGCGFKLLPVVSTLTCGSAVFSPDTFSQNASYTGTITLPYTGGNGATYGAGAPIASTGVTGLSATLLAGSLNVGAGDLTYSLSGTPTSGGPANFTFNFGGASCTATVTVSTFPTSFTTTTTLLDSNHLSPSILPFFYDDLLTYTNQDVTVGNMQDLRLHQDGGAGNADIVQTVLNEPIPVNGKIRISWSRIERSPTGLGLIVEFRNGATTSQASIDSLLGTMPNAAQTASGNDMTITIDVVALTDTIIIKSSEDGDGDDPILLEIDVLDPAGNLIPITP